VCVCFFGGGEGVSWLVGWSVVWFVNVVGVKRRGEQGSTITWWRGNEWKAVKVQLGLASSSRAVCQQQQQQRCV
jgi:hypothetical protein